MRGVIDSEGERRLEAVVARLDGLINWERMKRTAATRFSLEPARDLCARLGNPQRDFGAVHVAGSKGKGSTAALIAGGLRAARLSEALYTSPHVVHLRERLRLRGKDVAAAPFAEALESALNEREIALAQSAPAGEATWFDLVTSAAFLAASRARCDWIVAECGLGGRLDSTNVLHASVCVITNIELEHQAVLGATRPLIAAEKAGILKPGCTLVCGVPANDEAGRAIDARAQELGVPVLRPLEGTWMTASIAERNAALAAAVLDELGRRGCVGEAGVPVGSRLLDERTRRQAQLPGRLEWFSVQGVPVALDGAHVPSSVRDALRDLRSQCERPGPPVIVLGLARDKDLEGILKAVSGLADRVVCTSVGSDLHFTPVEIAQAAAQVGLVAETAMTPPAALARALTLAGNGGWVVATGSLYLASSLRPNLKPAPTRPGC
jgi:dihydrofolate synthase/folylpolyglutamate synthase